MDLEYMKQIRNMYAEQHIVSKEFLNELKKAVCDNEAKIKTYEYLFNDCVFMDGSICGVKLEE